ncbi:MAG: hypothetical protein ACFUZC_10900 [Chthoniobacteraceae bacterium]
MNNDRVSQLISDYITGTNPREKLDPKMEVIRQYLAEKLGIEEGLIKGSHVVQFVTDAPEWMLKDMLRKTRNIGPKTLEKIRLSGRGTDTSA